ncbi:MAG TPA: lipid-A-disaccharide synthase N-terminal domain-containing protein [Verrucomicrobiae bacterium]
MDWLHNLVFPGGKLLGIEWHFWKVIGWVGNLVFFSRFIVQWYATEKKKQVVVPSAFWWLSLSGSLLLLSYALFYQKDSVFIFAYAFTWIPYIRNLIIHRRHKKAHLNCAECGTLCPPKSNYCFDCGAPLLPEQERSAAKAS